VSSRVTICIIALDEESRIASTLEAARATGAPVLVVDGGSTDRTVAVAEEAGCRVVRHLFAGFAEQRNWAMGQVETEYVLFVDADEVVTAELMDDVGEAIEQTVDAAWVPTLDYFAGRWMLNGGWYPQPHLRLLKVGSGHFGGSVHEAVSFDVPDPVVVTLVHPLLHRSHMTLTDYLGKLDRYTEIEAAEVTGSPWLLMARGIGEALAVLVRRMLWQRGWRDGYRGLIGAVFYAFYRFTIYAKAAASQATEAPTGETGMSRWRTEHGPDRPRR
jgi:glycosyltransferase involved in cell wall biosynthesis